MFIPPALSSPFILLTSLLLPALHLSPPLLDATSRPYLPFYSLNPISSSSHLHSFHSFHSFNSFNSFHSFHSFNSLPFLSFLLPLFLPAPSPSISLFLLSSFLSSLSFIPQSLNPYTFLQLIPYLISPLHSFIRKKVLTFE